MKAALGVGGFAIARRESSPTVAAAPPLSRRFATSRDGSLRAVLGFDSRRLHYILHRDYCGRIVGRLLCRPFRRPFRGEPFPPLPASPWWRNSGGRSAA